MHGYVTTFVAEGGRRDALVSHLLRASDLLASSDACLLYLVATTHDADHVVVTEVWADADAHDRSLRDPAVSELVSAARPLIADVAARTELVVHGGKGAPPPP